MTQVPEATSKQSSTSSFIIIASQQKLVMLNSRMNSANKAICYAEVIDRYSLLELFHSTPVHNTPQWYVHAMHTGTNTQNVYFLPVERSGLVRK